MFHEIRDHIINIVTSRLTVLTIMFFFFAGVLVYRCFNLQIINGEEYLNDFILQIEKTRDITSTRGRILDRNGNVLAENELAYSVKIEDVFESSRNKNAEVNDVVYRLIKLIEKNGDSVITDFKIVIDEDGDYVYSVDGTALLRFQADVLGYKTVDKLSEEEKAMTAQELMEYLSRAKGFAIGQYEDPEETDAYAAEKNWDEESEQAGSHNYWSWDQSNKKQQKIRNALYEAVCRDIEAGRCDVLHMKPVNCFYVGVVKKDSDDLSPAVQITEKCTETLKVLEKLGCVKYYDGQWEMSSGILGEQGKNE